MSGCGEERTLAAIHAVYWPTTGIRPGDAVTFKVRSFRVGKTEGKETWDFGDGSPKVAVQSDGNAVMHAYKKAGTYLVSVSRTNARGETATGRLCVRVE